AKLPVDVLTTSLGGVGAVVIAAELEQRRSIGLPVAGDGDAGGRGAAGGHVMHRPDSPSPWKRSRSRTRRASAPPSPDPPPIHAAPPAPPDASAARLEAPTRRRTTRRQIRSRRRWRRSARSGCRRSPRL